jgi:hypothetical protein
LSSTELSPGVSRLANPRMTSASMDLAATVSPITLTVVISLLGIISSHIMEIAVKIPQSSSFEIFVGLM